MRILIRSTLLCCVLAALSACNTPAKETPKETKEALSAAPSASTAPSASASGSAAPDGAEKPKKRRHGRRPHRDVASLLLHGARKLTLADDAKAKVDPVLAKAKDLKSPEGKEAAKALQKAIGEAVKAGKLDLKALEPQLAAVEKARETLTKARAGLLNELHAALAPEQRKALVASIREQLAKHAGHGGPDAAAAASGSAAAAPSAAPSAAASAEGAAAPSASGSAATDAPGAKGHSPIRFMLEGVDLTPEQEKKVEELVKKGAGDRDKKIAEMKKAMEERKKKVEAVLTAFEKDKFDAAKLDLSGHANAKDELKKHFEQMQELVALLTPEQREKFAATLESRHGRGHHGEHGGAKGDDKDGDDKDGDDKDDDKDDAKGDDKDDDDDKDGDDKDDAKPEGSAAPAASAAPEGSAKPEEKH